MFTTQVYHGFLVRHAATSNIKIDAVARAQLRWFDHPRFDPELPVLWDCRHHFVDISIAELEEIDQHTLVHTDRRRAEGGRSAILVSSSVVQDALERTVATNPSLLADVRIFTEERQAFAWLGVEIEMLDEA